MVLSIVRVGPFVHPELFFSISQVNIAKNASSQVHPVIIILGRCQNQFCRANIPGIDVYPAVVIK